MKEGERQCIIGFARNAAHIWTAAKDATAKKEQREQTTERGLKDA